MASHFLYWLRIAAHAHEFLPIKMIIFLHFFVYVGAFQIDSKLRFTKDIDCIRRIHLGAKIQDSKIYRSSSGQKLKDCESSCLHDKDCYTLHHRVSAKGNTTCGFSTATEDEIRNKTAFEDSHDYDVYVKKKSCHSSIHKACYRRVFGGRRVVRSLVVRVIHCNRLEDCQRECTDERRFHCETFNYRLDASLRGQGLCELMTKPVEHLDLRRDFIEDPEYDFYELDRNSKHPDCKPSWFGRPLPHSGYLSGSDEHSKPPSHSWRPDHGRPGYGVTTHPESYPHHGYGPYKPPHYPQATRNKNLPSYPTDNHLRPEYEGKWSGYGHRNPEYDNRRPEYDNRRPEYDNRRPEYDNRRPEYDNRRPGYDTRRPKPWPSIIIYGHRGYGYYNDQHKYNELDYGNREYFGRKGKGWNNGGSYGSSYYKSEDEYKHTYNYWNSGTKETHASTSTGIKPYDKIENPFDYSNLARRREHNAYNYGQSYKGKVEKWRNLGGLVYGESSYYGSQGGAEARSHVEDDYPIVEEGPPPDIPSIPIECSQRRQSDMAIGENAIRRALSCTTVTECEAACLAENQFKCVSYSFRTSNDIGGPNCFLSETLYTGLGLSRNGGSSVYSMENNDCGEHKIDHVTSLTPQLESECFWHVRSGHVMRADAVQAALIVQGLGACEAECIRAYGFVCRAFSYRFDPPRIGEPAENCLLTSADAVTLIQGAGLIVSEGHEVYARGDLQHGCQTPVLHDDSGDDNFMGGCYLQYDNAAKLLTSSIRGQAHTQDELTCAKACDDAPFNCFSFSFSSSIRNADNCFLSEIRLSDLKMGVDYIHSADNWLFAYNLFHRKCWRKIVHSAHGQELPSHLNPPAFLPTYGPPMEHYGPSVHHGNDRPRYVPGGSQDVGGNGLIEWSHYTVSGLPCRRGTSCAKNTVTGHWSCEPEGGEHGAWDYCCAPMSKCGYSDGFDKPWCYVGPTKEQWRPCSDKYYPYHHHHGTPHPTETKPQYPPERNNKYWDDLHANGPKAYYDDQGRPLPGFSRVPPDYSGHQARFEDHHETSASGHWYPVTSPDNEEPPFRPSSPCDYGVSRYWPVAYLHKEAPPNTTLYNYKPSIKNESDHVKSSTLSNIVTPLPKLDIIKNITALVNSSVINDTIDFVSNLTMRTGKSENDINGSETISVENATKTVIENTTKAPASKLGDFSSTSLEILNLDDEMFDNESVASLQPGLKSLEQEEEWQIEEIGRILANNRGKLNLEKRSQSDLETKNAMIDKEFKSENFKSGSKFVAASIAKVERRGLIEKVPKELIRSDSKNIGAIDVKSANATDVSEEVIKKAFINGKVFYDASGELNTNRPETKLSTDKTTAPPRRVYQRIRYNPREVRRRLLQKEGKQML